MIEDHEDKLTGSGGGIVIKGEGLYDEMKAFKEAHPKTYIEYNGVEIELD